MTTYATTPRTSTVRANGIDIQYVEAGSGPPLVLLHGGFVTTSDLWADSPVAYQRHMARLAERFHVIAPDTRGSGGTRHDGRPMTMSLLADDVAALVEALGLERPAVCGFSEGGMTATILALTHPESVGALVNDAGFDTFDPDAPVFTQLRVIFGGSPDAAEADPDVAAANSVPMGMGEVFATMQADQDAAQGPGHWRTYLKLFFERGVHWPGYTFADWARITVPALVVVGDRDMFCSVEDAGRAYQALPNGELAVVPDTDHTISDAKIAAILDFLGRI
jgi:pimeloyl-ACP methyl ester carboxylesterase